jgi:hypothetical protein
MATPAERLGTIMQLANDPVAALTDKEIRVLVYHALMYEIHELRLRRICRRQIVHGKLINQEMDIANFKHELQDL